MFSRYYQTRLSAYLRPGRVLVIYGARRVGKTYLVEQFLENYEGRVFTGVGEDRLVREILESESVQKIKSSFSGYDLIVLDEAQKINNVGTGLKLIADHLPQTAVIATGSSSFDLASLVGEPLTGRKRNLELFPLSVMELKAQFGPMRPQELLEELLLYGAYPETLTLENVSLKRNYLNELRDSYLCKDILELENIRNSRKLLDLLTLIAFQIGQEVSLNELGTSLSLSKQTVARYLDLLEKTFVIKNVRGYSGNLRKEITKMSRYYFYDNGVRNAVINNFNPLSRRHDVGQLWENFLFIERLKMQHYTGIASKYYFWRTYDRQEIDHVEERDGNLYGYEFKYSPERLKGPPTAWSQNYRNAEFSVVTRENFVSFIS